MKKIHWILLGLVTLASLVLQYFGPPHPHPHAWDSIPLFYCMFGFVGCVLIIVVSKFLGKAWLQKKEDYYKGENDA
ncbi:hypothetical protein [Pelagicoccus sp. SDUM812003]|uniref:hypothetical protein n=1 Tax=Pelagicoccus sp. SDUM812003 TaxID=3041267 RepID=UPI00280F9B1C|nr:hypothetical protein [Pelagicoccus sp. SDUM812003]MDQ8202060.1 hypothetical protein [Pelagicoccus sp. SDUM812003]